MLKWSLKHSASDERFYRKLSKRVREAAGVSRRPKVWDINQPVFDAYDYVVTWADGMGGFSDAALTRFFSTPRGRYLPPETRRRIWRQVPKLVQVLREHQREELERARGKK